MNSEEAFPLPDTAVCRVVESLPADQRNALLDRFWLRKDYTEIAKGLGIEEGAALILVSRALAKVGSIFDAPRRRA